MKIPDMRAESERAFRHAIELYMKYVINDPAKAKGTGHNSRLVTPF